jgi:hypothetical protein
VTTRARPRHLQHSYRALGVTSRTEALARLRGQVPGEDPAGARDLAAGSPAASDPVAART